MSSLAAPATISKMPCAMRRIFMPAILLSSGEFSYSLSISESATMVAICTALSIKLRAGRVAIRSCIASILIQNMPEAPNANGQAVARRPCSPPVLGLQWGHAHPALRPRSPRRLRRRARKSKTRLRGIPRPCRTAQRTVARHRAPRDAGPPPNPLSAALANHATSKPPDHPGHARTKP